MIWRRSRRQMIRLELGVEVCWYIDMLRRIKRDRKERRDKLTLCYDYDYSCRLALVVVENTIMMTGRLVCGVYVWMCMYVSIKTVVWRQKEKKKKQRTFLSLSPVRSLACFPFSYPLEQERKEATLWTDIFLSRLSLFFPLSLSREREQGESDIVSIRGVFAH